jgi:lipoprotein signal peptidase
VALSLRHWRPRHLLLAWVAYWILALLIALRSAIASIVRLTSDPDAHGSVSADVTDGIFNLSVTSSSGVVWQGSAPLMSIVLWAAGPPLLLFLVWLALRPRVAGEPALSSRPQR